MVSKLKLGTKVRHLSHGRYGEGVIVEIIEGTFVSVRVRWANGVEFCHQPAVLEAVRDVR